MTLKFPIYMDHHATTPVDPRVLETMLPYFSEKFGNATSHGHTFGWEAEQAVEKARSQVADLIGASPKEIIFTSGATEADNLAIKGVALALAKKGSKHIVTSKIEHKAVLESCHWLETQSWEVTYLTPEPTGLISPSTVAAALRPETVLCSIMLANNEVGTINPVASIARICSDRGVFFHTDAAQGVGKVSLDVYTWGIDLCSLSAHKLYGPKGVGALYARRNPSVPLEAQMCGGGQERGLRSGTLNVPGIVGLGETCRLAQNVMGIDVEHQTRLRTRLQAQIMSNLPNCKLNGHPTDRLPGNLNLSFDGVDGESLIMSLKGVALSSGSACTSATREPSYVLRALGLPDDLAYSAVRFGLGRFNTIEEVDYVSELVVDRVKKLRDLNPQHRPSWA